MQNNLQFKTKKSPKLSENVSYSCLTVHGKDLTVKGNF